MIRAVFLTGKAKETISNNSIQMSRTLQLISHKGIRQSHLTSGHFLFSFCQWKDRTNTLARAATCAFRRFFFDLLNKTGIYRTLFHATYVRPDPRIGVGMKKNPWPCTHHRAGYNIEVVTTVGKARVNHDTDRNTYRCFLPDLTGFVSVCCMVSSYPSVAPSPQR